MSIKFIEVTASYLVKWLIRKKNRLDGFIDFAANRLSAGSETINDLRRLCSIFGNVEKLMTVAASLHRKFQKASSLSQAIFTDYCKFHAKTMGTGSKEEDDELVN